jgi:predicted nucleic acid-binding protein
MPTRGRGSDLLVDTSVAVALVVADHENHEATQRALDTYRALKVQIQMVPEHRA